MLCADVEQEPPGGLDGGRDRTPGWLVSGSDQERNQIRVREVVARVVKEAVNRTSPRSSRKVGELLFELGYGSSKNPGEPYSEGAIRAWMNQRDRPLAEVIVALALHHELSLDEYLWGDGLRHRVNELEELMLKIARHVEYDLPARGEATTGD